jgi:hypothetical protein
MCVSSSSSHLSSSEHTGNVRKKRLNEKEKEKERTFRLRKKKGERERESERIL